MNMHGIGTGYAWNMYGICIEYAWNITETECNMHGICGAQAWQMHGIWNLRGMDMLNLCNMNAIRMGY
jgi:hypothetical protein